MTYRELAQRLSAMPDKHLDADINVLLLDTDKIVHVIDFVTDWTKIKSELDEVDMDDYYSQGIDLVVGFLPEGQPYLTVVA